MQARLPRANSVFGYATLRSSMEHFRTLAQPGALDLVQAALPDTDDFRAALASEHER